MKKLITLVLALALIMSCVIFTSASAEGEVMQLTWVQGTSADAPTDVATVQEALDAYTTEKLGCTVQIIYMTNEQVNLSISAGEVYDMYFTCDWYNDYNTAVANGYFADITDKIQTVTPDLYATMPEEVWELAKVNGKLYAIPVKKDYAPEIFVVYDKDFFDSVNMEWPDQLESFADLEQYAAAYKEANPDAYPFLFAGAPSGLDGFFEYFNRDAAIGINYENADSTSITSVYEDEEMINRLTLMRKWYEAGYVNPDAATTDTVDSKISSIKFAQAWVGYDYSPSYGYTCGMSMLNGPYLSTSGVQGSMNAFSVTLEEDEARLEMAMKYQELVNTDLKFRDMLRYGLEGTHFNYQEDGSVIRTQAGKDNYNPWAFSQGSYALSSVETSEGVKANVNQWEETFASYDNAILGKANGFSFDPTPVETQINQISVVKEKYVKQLWTGTIDPATELPKFLEEMRAAGLDDVIKECQTQYDAFLAAKAA